MDREEVILLLKTMFSHSVEKERFTECSRFHCVYNTGWDCEEYKYKCRLGNEQAKCKAGR